MQLALYIVAFILLLLAVFPLPTRGYGLVPLALAFWLFAEHLYGAL